MKCIKEDRDIEQRCNSFLQGFKVEVNTKLDKMQAEIQDIQDKMKRETKGTRSEKMVREVCSNLNDRIAIGRKNLLIFNLPENTGTKEEANKQDQANIAAFTKTVTVQDDMEAAPKRLGKKTDKPCPVLVTFKDMVILMSS